MAVESEKMFEVVQMRVARPGQKVRGDKEHGIKGRGKGGRRIRVAPEKFGIGPNVMMYIGTTIFGGGSVRLTGLVKWFPGRSKQRRGVPAKHLNPEWTR